MTKSTYKKKKAQLQRQARAESAGTTGVAAGAGTPTPRPRPTGPSDRKPTKAQQARETALRRERSLGTRVRRNPWPIFGILTVLVLALIVVAVNYYQGKNPGTTASTATPTAASGVTTPITGTTPSPSAATATSGPMPTLVAYKPGSDPGQVAAVQYDQATATAVAVKGLFPTPVVAQGQEPQPPASYKAVSVKKDPITEPKNVDPNKVYMATYETTKGTFVARLDPKLAPQTVSAIVSLIQQHFYDGVSFHRYIPGFVIQGGDPTGTGSGGPTLKGQPFKFADEPVLGNYQVGSLAMANSGKDTNGSQFFIILGDQGVQLPKQYNLYGQIVSGMDVALSLRWGDVMKKVTVQEVSPTK